MSRTEEQKRLRREYDRTPERKEKKRAANARRWSTPEGKEKILASNERWRSTPEAKEKKRASDARRRRTPEFREKQRACYALSRSTPEFMEKQRSRLERWRRKHGKKTHEERRDEYIAVLHAPAVREKVRTVALSKREKHESALAWSLRSPDGVVFRFKNLACFIREHREFFTAEQLLPVNRKGRTRIEASLHQLSPRNKYCQNHAHGWTWHIDGKEPETYLGTSPNDPKEDTSHE